MCKMWPSIRTKYVTRVTVAAYLDNKANLHSSKYFS